MESIPRGGSSESSRRRPCGRRTSSSHRPAAGRREQREVSQRGPVCTRGDGTAATGDGWFLRPRHPNARARTKARDSYQSDPETGVVPGVTRDRNVRSRRRRSMYPAIHINSRSWLRSSSTHEPSDPPLRAIMVTFRRQRPGNESDDQRRRGLQRSAKVVDEY